MEFGCRYIYVADQPFTQNTDQNILHPNVTATLQPMSEDLMYDAPEPVTNEYNNFQLEENVHGGSTDSVPVSDNDNSQTEDNQSPLQATEIFSETFPRYISHGVNVYDSVPTPTPAQLKNENIPPPVPSRKKKPSLVPDIVIPSSDLPVPANLHISLPSSTAIEIKSDGRPPPVPSRKLKPSVHDVPEPLPQEGNVYEDFSSEKSKDLKRDIIPPAGPCGNGTPTLLHSPDAGFLFSGRLSPALSHYEPLPDAENAYEDVPSLGFAVSECELKPPPLPMRGKRSSVVHGSESPQLPLSHISSQRPEYIDVLTAVYEEAKQNWTSPMTPHKLTAGQPLLPSPDQMNPAGPAHSPRLLCRNAALPPPPPTSTFMNPTVPPSSVNQSQNITLVSSLESPQLPLSHISSRRPEYIDVLPAPYEEAKQNRTSPMTPHKLTAGQPLLPSPDQMNPAGPAHSPRLLCRNAALPPLPPTSTFMNPTVPPSSVNQSQNITVASSLAPLEMTQLPANCNILLLNVGKMIDTSDFTLNLETPSFCRHCSASLSSLNQVQGNKTWTCVFCATENSIGANEQSDVSEGDQLFLCRNLLGHGSLSSEEEILIFCIDISGSMSVTLEILYDNKPDSNGFSSYTSRMEAMKCSLMKCLQFLHSHHPNKRVALVTFSDQVKLYGDGTSQPQILEDCELLDTDYLKSQGENQPIPHTIAHTLGALESKIECLNETGATALGPAALVCIAMASRRPGSKVIICTDGRANTDLGNLEDITEDYVYQSSKLYYSNLAEMALQHSVVVSVVTIEGTDCRLPELGQLADKTGGKVNIVHPLKLDDEFQSIVEENINATDVKVKVYLPNSMYFLYEAHTEPIMERMIGSTTSDSILSMEFNVKTSKIQDVLRHSQLPIQVELTFCLPDGRRGHRILSHRRPVTNDSSAALDSLNLNVLQIHSAQISAQLAIEGRVDEASKTALALKELVALVMQHENYEAKGEEYDEWENCMSPIYEDLQVYVKRDGKNDGGTHTDAPVIKTFSDEMANMIFKLKQTKKKVLQKLQK